MLYIYPIIIVELFPKILSILSFLLINIMRMLMADELQILFLRGSQDLCQGDLKHTQMQRL